MTSSLETRHELQFEAVAEPMARVTAIVVAAGNATRMGRDKQMIPLQGVPVLARTLHVFDLCPEIQHIVVVTRAAAVNEIEELCRQYEIDKLVCVVAGGDSRQESVRLGVEACPADTEYYAIHDGARPLVSEKCIREAIAGAVRTGAAATGVQVKDTLKRVNQDKKIIKTPEREGLIAVQTPQVFRRDIYQKALALCAEQGWQVTDDCALCERAGFDVFITEGSYRNIKITTVEDIAIAEALLNQERSE